MPSLPQCLLILMLNRKWNAPIHLMFMRRTYPPLCLNQWSTTRLLIFYLSKHVSITINMFYNYVVLTYYKHFWIQLSSSTYTESYLVPSQLSAHLSTQLFVENKMLARNYLGKYSATPKIIKISLNKYWEHFLIIWNTILYYNITCYFTLNITHNVELIS